MRSGKILESILDVEFMRLAEGVTVESKEEDKWNVESWKSGADNVSTRR